MGDTTLKGLKELVTRELRKNVEKGSMNPAEVDSVSKAVNVLEKIAKIEQICKETEMMEQNPDAYSGAFYNIRNFPPMSHDRGNSYRNSYGYDWEPEMGYSGERGRSSRTGRYTSRGDYSGERSYENMGGNQSRDSYSGHSINDRMIDQLERMMDAATSEFEKQQILEKIKMIRNSPDHAG